MQAFHHAATCPSTFSAANSRMRPKRLPRAVKQALLTWLLLSAIPSAQTTEYGKVEITGFYWTNPYNGRSLVGEHIDLRDTRLGLTAGVINAASGQLSLATLDLAGLYVGSNHGWGNVFLDDRSILRLWGDFGRLSIGENGDGYMVVSKGSLVDATNDRTFSCHDWCGVIIGATAGSNGTLTLTDRDTLGRFTALDIGTTHLETDYGIAGGITHATLNVLNGATIYSDNGVVADYFPSPMLLGTESVYGQATISGSGSAWHIGGQYGVRAVLEGANHTNGHAFIDVEQGGLITISALGSSSGVNLGFNGGQAEMRIAGTGSALQMAAGGFVNIGTNYGTASLSIANGGAFSGGREIRIGDSGGKGVLVISGPGASALFDADSNLHLGASYGDGTLAIQQGGNMSVANIWAGEGGGTAHISVTGAGSKLTSSFPAGPGNDIQLGNSGYGQLDVSGGGAVTARGISMGSEGIPGSPGGIGNVNVSGVGSSITLDATSWHRLGLENGTLTVSDGGLFDAGAGQAACWSSWCGAFIGSNAGADANVIVTGAGSRAVFASSFRIGSANAGRTPVETYNYGITGATTHANVSVLDGGRLETSSVVAGIGAAGSATSGTEQVDVVLRVIGKNSVWAVTGIPGATDAAGFYTGAPVTAGSGDNVNVDLQILQGGKLQLGQAGQTFAGMQLGADSGRTTALVSGAGSTIEFLADDGMLSVGQNNAYASLNFTKGA